MSSNTLEVQKKGEFETLPLLRFSSRGILYLFKNGWGWRRRFQKEDEHEGKRILLAFFFRNKAKPSFSVWKPFVNDKLRFLVSCLAQFRSFAERKIFTDPKLCAIDGKDKQHQGIIHPSSCCQSIQLKVFF